MGVVVQVALLEQARLVGLAAHPQWAVVVGGQQHKVHLLRLPVWQGLLMVVGVVAVLALLAQVAQAHPVSLLLKNFID
jgi:hypothetical protein